MPDSAILPPPQAAGPTRLLDRAGLAVTLLLPLALVLGDGIAEASLTALSALFLGRSVVLRDWGWLRAAWIWAALAWWAWLLASAMPAGLGQASGLIRLLLLAAALEHWTLRQAAARIWLARLLLAAALYFALRSLLPLAAGLPADPQAGLALSQLLFPALLPVVGRWTGMTGWRPPAGMLLALAATGVMVATGQPMPLLSTVLGLFVIALLLPRLRGVVLFSLIAAGLLLRVLPIAPLPAPGWIGMDVPGLLLCGALMLAWLRRVGQGLRRDPDPLRVGLFVAVLIGAWPLASAGTLGATPLAGWFFVLLGLGLAEARAYMTAQSAARNLHA